MARVEVFCCAILSNHFHLILRSRPDVVASWNDAEVARRWLMLCPKRRTADNRPEEPTESELDWQARYRAVRLLDETAILACAAYVDLNPIRAAMAQTIETSDYTSAQQRALELQESLTVTTRTKTAAVIRADHPAVEWSFGGGHAATEHVIEVRAEACPGSSVTTSSALHVAIDYPEDPLLTIPVSILW